MAAVSVAKLRSKAKQAGIPAGEIRSARTAPELQELIDSYNGDSTPRKKSAVKKKVSAQRKRGTVRKSGRSKSSPAVKSRKRGEAKRATTAPKRSTAKRATRKRATQSQDENMGRFTLNELDFSKTDGWNAREGSGPDRIIKALRKFRGNRQKVIDSLEGDVWDFVGKKFRNGQKRTRKDALEMLKYRVSRTAWDFAMRTGQHQASENRVEYGKGGTGEGIWKPARKRAAEKRFQAPKRKGAAKSAPKRSAAQKRSQSARKAPKRQAAKRQTAKRGSAKRRTAKR